MTTGGAWAVRVLVADDDEFMRLLVAEVLRGAGHDVLAVPDGVQAWAAYERERPPLVFLDWQMPGLDGLEVCTRIRRADPERVSFVLVVTAQHANDALVTMLDAGADDYVTKPVTPEQLAARLAIAERRLAQQAAQRDAEAQLARARWLAGIGETTLALQHEINNPLAALLGNAALLDDGVGGEEREACVAALVDQAKRIGAVVKRLASLQEPRSVEYVGGEKMLDLSGRPDLPDRAGR